jgi:hypothetical protein
VRRSTAENKLAQLLAQPRPVLAGGWLREVREALEAVGIRPAEAAQLGFVLLGRAGMTQRDARTEAQRLAAEGAA